MLEPTYGLVDACIWGEVEVVKLVNVYHRAAVSLNPLFFYGGQLLVQLGIHSLRAIVMSLKNNAHGCVFRDVVGG